MVYKVICAPSPISLVLLLNTAVGERGSASIARPQTLARFVVLTCDSQFGRG